MARRPRSSRVDVVRGIQVSPVSPQVRNGRLGGRFGSVRGHARPIHTRRPQSVGGCDARRPDHLQGRDSSRWPVDGN